MKLKTKISIASVGMLLLLSLAFSIWNVSMTQKQIMANILRYEADQLNEDTWRFERNFNQMDFQNSRGEQYAGRSAFRSLYSKSVYNKDAVLYYNGQELDNTTPYQFDLTEEAVRTRQYTNDVIEDSENISTFVEEINGQHLLILIRDTSIKNPHTFYIPGKYGFFQILHYRDITSVYESKKTLLLQSIAVSLSLCVLLGVLLTLILRKILVPFYHLRDAANVIAEGGYDKRVENPGNDEIGEVSRCFNQMADRVEEHICTLTDMNEKQRQLIGSLAHELKTPMTGIQGYAELLQRVKLPPEKQTDALRYIEEECSRLSRLSSKMLQLTELADESKIAKQHHSLSALFAQAEEITHFRLKEKKIRLQIELDEELEIECDEDLLLSFLTNLIDNACKASPENSSIRLIGTNSGIFVVDEGRGIPEEEISRITEPFYMVDKSRSRKEGGAGLGLALCLQIARLHGGRLEIKSEPGKGTCIEMRFGNLLKSDYAD